MNDGQLFIEPASRRRLRCQEGQCGEGAMKRSSSCLVAGTTGPEPATSAVTTDAYFSNLTIK
jgi:hypothetical protein